jgi:hypothetical protein
MEERNSHVLDFDQCEVVQAAFSEYLDGAVGGRDMLAIASHLEECPPCNTEFLSWQSMQHALTGLRSTRVPANMALKLRVAISQEKARQEKRWIDSFQLSWDNALRPLLLQVSAGFAGTIVLIGGVLLLLGVFAVPQAVMAHDVPLGAMTSPHYLYSAANQRPILADRDTLIVVEAAINAAGRVYDYKIVSGPESAEVENQVREQLMLSVFEPARVFGSPVRGEAIMTFAGISVRG